VSGEQKIPRLAPVKSDQRSSPEVTRSEGGALFTGIASEELSVLFFIGAAQNFIFWESRWQGRMHDLTNRV
jgi:hypothetical protein